MANGVKPQREHWGSRIGFILAAAGSAIGLGNVWKFPYITFDNHGGAFVLVYLICICLVGFPIMVAEILIGKKTNLNPIGAFALLRKKSWWPLVGWMGLLAGFVILSYYSVIAGWTLEYTIKSLMGTFKNIGLKDADNMFIGFLGNPYKQVGWHFVFMGLTTIIILGGVSKGIERWSKIMMPLLFLMILTLMIYSLSTGAAKQALQFMFRPNFSELTPHGIMEALGHAFFTLSLGMGVMLTYGSYMGRKDNIVISAFAVTFFDTLIAIMACLVMYPIIFMENLTPEELKSIGIIFTTIPTILAKLPGGSFIGVLFFLLVAFAALTSTISLLEVVVACAVDQLNWKRTKSTLLAGSAIFLFGVPSALSNGGVGWISKLRLLPKGEVWLNWLDSFDYLASNWMLPLGGLLIAIFCGWILTKSERATEFLPYQKRMPTIWGFILKYVTPVLVLIVLLNKIGVITL
jgi:NSS family neurotransmitter:Na+ symporter